MARKKPSIRGRRKGTPNLIRTDEYITNQYGVQITKDEERRLKNAARAANRRRQAMLDYYKDMPIFEGTLQLPESREQLRLMGEEMDIIIRKRSAGLQRFHSRKEFLSYLKNAEAASKTDYVEWRGRQYKANLQKAIQNEFAMFPDLVKGVNMKLRMMPQPEFQKLIASNRLFQIKSQYSMGDKLGRLMELREFLGLNTDLDDYDFDGYDEFGN